MKRIVRLTESDLTRIVRRVVSESRGLITEQAQQKGAQYYAKYRGVVDAAYNALVAIGKDMWVTDDDINVAYAALSKCNNGPAYVALCYKFWNTGVGGTSYDNVSNYINKIRPCGTRGAGSSDVSLSNDWGEMTGKRPQNEKLHKAFDAGRRACETLDGGIFKNLAYGQACYGGTNRGGQFAK